MANGKFRSVKKPNKLLASCVWSRNLCAGVSACLPQRHPVALKHFRSFGTTGRLPAAERTPNYEITKCIHAQSLNLHPVFHGVLTTLTPFRSRANFSSPEPRSERDFPAVAPPWITRAQLTDLGLRSRSLWRPRLLHGSRMVFRAQTKCPRLWLPLHTEKL